MCRKIGFYKKNVDRVRGQSYQTFFFVKRKRRFFCFSLLTFAILKHREYFLMLQTLTTKIGKQRKTKFGRIDSRGQHSWNLLLAKKDENLNDFFCAGGRWHNKRSAFLNGRNFFSQVWDRFHGSGYLSCFNYWHSVLLNIKNLWYIFSSQFHKFHGTSEIRGGAMGQLHPSGCWALNRI